VAVVTVGAREVLVLCRRTDDPDPAAADALLRRAVADVTGMPVDLVQVRRACPRCGSADHGRPVVLPGAGLPRPPYVSLSRTPGLLAVAATVVGPVGIDVERLDVTRFGGIDDVLLHPDERVTSVRDRAVTWVRKECYLKATGDGLVVDPRRLRMSGPDAPPQVLEAPAATGRRGAHLHDLDVGPDHVGGVAVLTGPAMRVTTRWAAPEAPAGRATPRTGQ
jgi:4'-phosphopantetheinyl transferase